MDSPDTNFKGDHLHMRNWSVRDLMEGGEGDDRHSPLCQPAYSQRPPWFQGRKRNGEGYNGVKYFPGAFQNRTRPHLLGIPGPREGL